MKVLMKHPEDDGSVPIGVFETEGAALEGIRKRLRKNHTMKVSKNEITGITWIEVEGPQVILGGDFGTVWDEEYRYKPESGIYRIVFTIEHVDGDDPRERDVYKEIDEAVGDERSVRIDALREKQKEKANG